MNAAPWQQLALNLTPRGHPSRAGEANPNAHLSAADVRRIRRKDPATGRYAEKGSLLAYLLGVTEKTVSLVRTRRRWGCIHD